MVYQIFPFNCVGFHPLYTLNNKVFFHCSCKSMENPPGKRTNVLWNMGPFWKENSFPTNIFQGRCYPTEMLENQRKPSFSLDVERLVVSCHFFKLSITYQPNLPWQSCQTNHTSTPPASNKGKGSDKKNSPNDINESITYCWWKNPKQPSECINPCEWRDKLHIWWRISSINSSTWRYQVSCIFLPRTH